MDFGPSGASRIIEIGQILAAGLIRQIARQSSPKSAANGEISLDITATRSGHPTRSEVENGL